jgi:hypothetical protein
VSTGDRRTQQPESMIAFAATVQAREMRFDEVPKVDVVFTGSPRYESKTDNDRTKLPDHVREAVTYHEVRVRHRCACRLRY